MADHMHVPCVWLRGVALAGIGVLGLAAIIGSGGGAISFPEGEPTFGNCCAIPAAFVDPARQTVQVGGTATFTAGTTGIVNPTYQWRRSSDGGVTYVDIIGATGFSYTLSGAQLPDDGTLFRVDVRSNGAAVAFASARLAVSSMPGVVFQDGEFLPADWTTSAIGSPAQNGPTHTEDQPSSGGNPGAYRRMAYALPQGPSSLRVFNVALAAVYDPPSQGAIHVIDYREDCSVASAGASIAFVDTTLLVEQAGRLYIAAGATFCQAAAWRTQASRASLRATDLLLAAGPACAAGESCPDFAATAAPLRFGYVRDATVPASGAAGSIEHGIDNWTVTVWRR